MAMRKKKMCVMSMISDFYAQKPATWWTPPNYLDYLELCRKAAEYDKLMNQPACEEAKKLQFIEGVEKMLKEKYGPTPIISNEVRGTSNV
jgi:hypothetical protein